tara:strand:+ start:4741 stop:4857 length:117 start_codon:yes stop_codon:yes gene_type:complete
MSEEKKKLEQSKKKIDLGYTVPKPSNVLKPIIDKTKKE